MPGRRILIEYDSENTVRGVCVNSESHLKYHSQPFLPTQIPTQHFDSRVLHRHGSREEGGLGEGVKEYQGTKTPDHPCFSSHCALHLP